MNHPNSELNSYLEQFISEKRIERLKSVLAQRTSKLRVVLENVYQAHNASAVLRSCDCFGIQHVHFIENNNTLRVSDEVAMGASSWLTVHRHRESQNNTANALRELKSQGYKIIATSPHATSCSIHDLPINRPTALVFGTELEGISDEVRAEADGYVYVPMFGFTESFNISVCAALCLFELSGRLRRPGNNWQLDETERESVYHAWLRASIDHSEAIIRDYLAKKER